MNIKYIAALVNPDGTAKSRFEETVKVSERTLTNRNALNAFLFGRAAKIFTGQGYSLIKGQAFDVSPHKQLSISIEKYESL